MKFSMKFSMKFRFISFLGFFLTSSLCAAPMFKITPVSTTIPVAKGDHAFITYTIENDIGFATRIKIESPVSPQPTKVWSTNCPISSGSLADGASCTVQLTTVYAAQSGILGSVAVYDASGSIGSQSTTSVRIIVQ